MSIAFRYAAQSDVGLMRKNNQDSGYAGPHLLVLADGMGGPAGGDIASSIAVAHLAPLDSDAFKTEELLHLLRDAINDAHQELVDRSKVDADLQGLGTTCIAILRSGNKLAMTHIGDSRAYLLRRGTLTQVTTDHSFVQYLVQTGQLSPEQAENHPQRSVLLRVLGDSEGEVVLDESIREGLVGDRWLLCSDGLSGVVSGETIGKVLHNTPDPAEACHHLVDLALKAGAPDNVTVVVADIIDADNDDPPSLFPQVVGAAATDRLAKTRGSQGAAGKAAALSQSAAEDDGDKPEKVSAKKRKKLTWKFWTKLVIALVLIASLIGGGIAAWNWSQDRYYVIAKNNHVYIYQGIDQSIGPIRFSHQVEKTKVTKSDLDEFQWNRMAKGVTQPTLQEAREYVADQLKNSARYQQKKAKSKPAPATPSPSPSSSSDGEEI